MQLVAYFTLFTNLQLPSPLQILPLTSASPMSKIQNTDYIHSFAPATTPTTSQNIFQIVHFTPPKTCFPVTSSHVYFQEWNFPSQSVQLSPTLSTFVQSPTSTWKLYFNLIHQLIPHGYYLLYHVSLSFIYEQGLPNNLILNYIATILYHCPYFVKCCAICWCYANPVEY